MSAESDNTIDLDMIQTPNWWGFVGAVLLAIALALYTRGKQVISRD